MESLAAGSAALLVEPAVAQPLTPARPPASVRPSPAQSPPGEESTPATVEPFEEFYSAQVDQVYRALAVTLGDPHLAREATDEAMARAYARWHTVGGYENPGGWVFRVGLNWATSWWRKVRRERLFFDPNAASHSEGAIPPPDAEAAVAVEALRRLPVVQRAVVVCRILLDLSSEHTATVLGIPEGTVKSRLARALTALRTTLSEENEA